MLIVISHSGIPVRLTDERWAHIVARHPEMESLKEAVLQSIAEPDMIQRGDFDELLAIRRYTDTSLGEKFLVVVYREIGEQDGFVLTAYLTRRASSRREILWKR